jgi:4-hydroxybenzoate polyprenyltransferase
VKPSAWTLWLSAFGGAAAWTAALLIVPTIGSVHCLAPNPNTERFGPAWWILVLLTGAAMAASIYAFGVNVYVLRHLDSGAQRERVRFMAFGGLFLNVAFILSLVFLGAGLFLAPVCQ